jgi:hypothetical protein
VQVLELEGVIEGIERDGAASAESQVETKRLSQEVSVWWLLVRFSDLHFSHYLLFRPLSLPLFISLSHLLSPPQCVDLTAQLEGEKALSADLSLKHAQALSELRTLKQESEAKIEVRNITFKCSPHRTVVSPLNAI